VIDIDGPSMFHAASMRNEHRERMRPPPDHCPVSRLGISGRPERSSTHVAATDPTGPHLATAGDLLERERACDRLTQALAQGREHGRVMVVEGPAGIGKTRLLQWAVAEANQRGFRVLEGCGIELERAYPFGVLQQLLWCLVDELDGHPALLKGAAAAAGRVLAKELPDGRDARPDPSYATLHGLYKVVVHASEDKPLLLVLDDAHWADPSSLRFVNFLASRVARLPVVVLVASRPRDPDGISELVIALSNHPSAELVGLHPLSEQATAAFVRARVGPDAAKEFCAACHEVTAGNPFFLGALVNEAERRELAPTPAAAAEVRAIAPDRVIQALLLRLGRLEPGACALAEAIAVLGDRSELRLAERLAGITHIEGRRAADQLVDAEVLRPSSRLEFVHPIIRSAIYTQLSPHTRSDAHLCAARMLTAEHGQTALIAAHLLATAPLGEPWVLEQLRRAARDAERRGAPDSSATYLRRALREPMTPDERAAVLLELAIVEPHSSPEMFAHVREALAGAHGLKPELAVKRARAVGVLSRSLLLRD
jgi:AAA ATPase domain